MQIIKKKCKSTYEFFKEEMFDDDLPKTEKDKK